MDKLTVLPPTAIASKKNILDYASKITEAKKVFSEFEKEFRERVLDYMDKEDLVRLENDDITVTKSKGQERREYDPETVEFVLGSEFIVKKINTTKLNKVYRDITGEQMNAIEETVKIKKTSPFIVIKNK
jgi:hypothetical protein